MADMFGNKLPVDDNNRCIICGTIIPEGRQACLACEADISERCDSKIKHEPMENLIEYTK